MFDIDVAGVGFANSGFFLVEDGRLKLQVPNADPQNVVPSESAAKVSGDHLRHVFPHESVTVITLRKR